MRTSEKTTMAIMLAFCLVCADFSLAHAQEEPSPVKTTVGPVPPNTVINMHNWQKYQQYMPFGLQALIEGKYYWKLPPDFQIEVGLTHHYAFPMEYRQDTEKYSKLVKIVNLRNGGHTITGYVAGLPFPNPAEPLKGWKILVDMWYAYVPHLFCGYDTFYLEDRFGNLQAEKAIQIYRKLSHISDYRQQVNDPRAKGIYYSEYVMLISPEQNKYTTNLTLYYTDNSKPIDTFLFIPSLRRSLRLSAAARCSPIIGTDFAQDDANKGNFNGNWQIFDSKVARDTETLQLMKISSWKNVGDLNNYYRPLFFPKPAIGKWEIRPTWLLDVRRIPSHAKGYCYAKSNFSVDKETYVSQWKENYDASMKLWKVILEPYVARNVPHEGWTDGTDNWFGPVWDLQSGHLTLGMSTDPEGDAWKFNEDCRNFQGQNFDDVDRYSTAAGLSQILR